MNRNHVTPYAPQTAISRSVVNMATWKQYSTNEGRRINCGGMFFTAPPRLMGAGLRDQRSCCGAIVGPVRRDAPATNKRISFRGHAFVARSSVTCSRLGSDPTKAVRHQHRRRQRKDTSDHPLLIEGSDRAICLQFSLADREGSFAGTGEIDWSKANRSQHPLTPCPSRRCRAHPRESRWIRGCLSRRNLESQLQRLLCLCRKGRSLRVCHQS